MSTYDPDKQSDKFEVEQADRSLNRTAQLETELFIAEQKIRDLREFMAEARSHEEELEDWLVEQQLRGDYPGVHRGLHVMQDGQVRFWDLND